MSQVILVVEDDEAIQAMVKVVLEKSGFEVLTAATGTDMYAVLESAEIDLIILDLGLPDGDALPHIQQVRDQFEIPVIVLTGRTKVDDRLMALGLGANDYLTKPIDPRELSLRVRNMLVRDNREPKPSASRTASLTPVFTKQPATSKSYRGIIYGIIIMLLAIGIGGYWMLLPASQQADTPSVMTPSQEPVSTQSSTKAPASAKAPESTPSPSVEESSEPLAMEPVDALVEVPVPAEKTSERIILSKAELLGYGWVHESKCNPVPDVEWWKLRTHEDIAGYVLRKYFGDWASLEKLLVGRLARLYGIAERNAGAVVKEGTTLRGEQLASYIVQFGERLTIVRCLAAEAEIAKTQK